MEKNLGLGGGWVAAAGETVTITLTNSNGAAANPSTPFVGHDRTRAVSSRSRSRRATPGQVTGHASSSLNLGSLQDPIVVQTDGQGQNGSDAVKTFVDARIHITPSATNRVGAERTPSRPMWRRTSAPGWVAARG